MATKAGIGATAYAASKAGVVGQSSNVVFLSQHDLYTKQSKAEPASDRPRRLYSRLLPRNGRPLYPCQRPPAGLGREPHVGSYVLLPVPLPEIVKQKTPGAELMYKFTPCVDLKPALQQAYLKDTPLSRVASPAEVADAAVFLASNGFANNCVLNLDGGLSAV